MRLISLSANKKSFKTVQFNHSGLSFVLAKQKDPEKSDLGKTYNGVGKSLLIALIHFCLGSSPNRNFETSLPGWQFTLAFKIGDTNHLAIRSTNTQSKITLDGKEMSIKDLHSFLSSKVFSSEMLPSGMTFKSLFSRFIRPKKDSYLSFESINREDKPYDKLLCNAFLLGLDIDLVSEKYEMRTEYSRINEIKKNLNKDPIFKEYFTSGKDASIDIQDLDEEIQRISTHLKIFQVADDFYDIQKEADQIKVSSQRKKNEATVLQNSIRNISNSLKEPLDISPEKLIRIYDEAKVSLPELLKKQIQEVTEFHKKLITNRIKRLTNEKIKLERQLEKVNSDISALGLDLNKRLEYLSTTHALDEYLEVSNRLSELNNQSQKLRDYKGLIDKYKSATQEISLHMANDNRRASRYLEEVTSVINLDNHIFRKYAKALYPNKTSGLSVTNNEGDNQLRFNINARIEDDVSEGINNMKIFCYDMTILLARHNHNLDFVFHDSRLFHGPDPRQLAVLCKLVHETCKEKGIQYIATLNEDQVNSIRGYLTSPEFDRIISDNIVLTLTDESAESKLLGIEVDMNYSTSSVYQVITT